MGRRGFLNRTEILTAEDRPVAKEVFVVEFERK
jgi:hypothetical protein